MKGLIIKDFLNVFKNLKFIGIVIIFYAVMASFSDEPGNFIVLFTLLFAMYFLSTFSLDEYAKWDAYALTMPLSRDSIVQGKYITMILMSLCGFTISSVLLIFFNFVFNQRLILEEIKYNAAGLAAVIFIYSILLPVIAKFGIVKARIYIFIICMLPSILGSMLAKSALFERIKEKYPVPPEKLVEFLEMAARNIYIIAPLVLIAVLFISYTITVRIYRKKEF